MSNNTGIEVVLWKSETKFFSGSVCQTSVTTSSPYGVGVHTETTLFLQQHVQSMSSGRKLKIPHFRRRL